MTKPNSSSHQTLWLVPSLVLTLTVGTLAEGPKRDQTPPPPPAHHVRLDKALNRVATSAGTSDTTRVIVRALPGQKDALKQQLQSDGYDVQADHDLIDAVTI